MCEYICVLENTVPLPHALAKALLPHLLVQGDDGIIVPQRCELCECVCVCVCACVEVWARVAGECGFRGALAWGESGYRYEYV